jgi:hypothetical protein
MHQGFSSMTDIHRDLKCILENELIYSDIDTR